VRIPRLIVLAAGALTLVCAGTATATAAATHTARTAVTHHAPLISSTTLRTLHDAVSTPKLSPRTHNVPLSAHHHGGRTANQTSNNWSGYAAQGSTYTSVSSSWTEPSVSCNTNGIVAFWIGLDGWGSSTVEQDGTGVDCSSGSPQHFAWWETYPANAIQEYSDPVSPGDSMTSTVTDEGNGTYEMDLTDNTQGWTENNPVSASGQDASAEIIAEAVTSGSSVTQLPDFGSVSFSGSQIDGATMESAGAQAIDMTDSSGNVIASTGASDGQGDFTVTYVGSGGSSAASRAPSIVRPDAVLSTRRD
jgi:hypothetical protein